jgi:hypothetical protein
MRSTDARRKSVAAEAVFVPAQDKTVVGRGDID